MHPRPSRSRARLAFRRWALALLALTPSLPACSSPGIASPPSASDPRLALAVGHPDRVDAELEIAAAVYEANPGDEDAAVWYGRRLAYDGQLEKALAVYAKGIEIHPTSVRLHRHRGHRLISLLRFEEAEVTLQRAADLCVGSPDAVELDGAPNPAGIPRSTTQGNVHYHLALARFLRGNFAGAAVGWTRCLELARNDDTTCASSYWLYNSLRRCGHEDEAREVLEAIRGHMDVIENLAYRDLLLAYQRGNLDGLMAAEDDAIQNATLAFGMAHYLLVEGRREQARELLQRLVQAPPSLAFGRIAAEVELARSFGP